MAELRECPFCGSKNVEVQIGYHMRTDAKVGCAECSAEGPLFGANDVMGLRDWTERAIAAWNRRADDRLELTPAGRALLEGDKP